MNCEDFFAAGKSDCSSVPDKKMTVLLSVKLLTSYLLPVQGELTCCIFRCFKSIFNFES